MSSDPEPPPRPLFVFSKDEQTLYLDFNALVAAVGQVVRDCRQLQTMEWLTVTLEEMLGIPAEEAESRWEEIPANIREYISDTEQPGFPSPDRTRAEAIRLIWDETWYDVASILETDVAQSLIQHIPPLRELAVRVAELIRTRSLFTEDNAKKIISEITFQAFKDALLKAFPQAGLEDDSETRYIIEDALHAYLGDPINMPWSDIAVKDISEAPPALWAH